MRRRGLIFVTVMSMITFGIYDIYWAFSTRYELVRKGHDVPSPFIVLAPLLGLVLVAVMQILSHLFFSSGHDVLNVLSVLVGIVSVIAIIPAGIYWLWKYSKAVGKVTDDALSAEVSFVIALVSSVIGFGFIWPIVVQYYYNQLAK